MKKNILLLDLCSHRQVAEMISSIIDNDKNKPIYFIGYQPSINLISVIESIIAQGYRQNVVITNLVASICDCGVDNCINEQLKRQLMPDDLFLFDHVQHPDLVEIVPKLGGDVLWVINKSHKQKDKLIAWISS